MAVESGEFTNQEKLVETDEVVVAKRRIQGMVDEDNKKKGGPLSHRVFLHN